MLLSVITALTAAISKAWGNYQERKQVEHQTALTLELAKQKIIEQQVANEHQLSTTRLESTGKYFKYITFFMWFGPFILICVSPEDGVLLFDSLKLAPQWYVQSCTAIMFTVWSIAVSRDTVQSIFTNLASYMDKRRLVVLKRKLFYDTLRSVKGNITQHEVDALEKALDSLEGKQQQQ